MPQRHPSWSRPSRSPAGRACLGVQALGQLVQDVRVLCTQQRCSRLSPHLAKRLPEAERTSATAICASRQAAAPTSSSRSRHDCELSRMPSVNRQAPSCFRRRANDDQDALRCSQAAPLNGCRRPHVDVALCRQIALLQRTCLVHASLRRRWSTLIDLARPCDERRQRFFRSRRLNALQVEDRDQHLKALRRRAYRGRIDGEYRMRAPRSFAVAHPRLANGDRPIPS